MWGGVPFFSDNAHLEASVLLKPMSRVLNSSSDKIGRDIKNAPYCP